MVQLFTRNCVSHCVYESGLQIVGVVKHDALAEPDFNNFKALHEAGVTSSSYR